VTTPAAADRFALLFSYGTLRRTDVQQATFGRLLVGSRDELLDYQLVPASTVGSPHANVMPAAAGRVPGMAFEVTEAELVAADGYERRDGYVRITASLASGRSTWVYVDARNGD